MYLHRLDISLNKQLYGTILSSVGELEHRVLHGMKIYSNAKVESLMENERLKKNSCSHFGNFFFLRRYLDGSALSALVDGKNVNFYC